MTELAIPPEAVLAAAKTLEDNGVGPGLASGFARRAIRAADEARGMRMEREHKLELGQLRTPWMDVSATKTGWAKTAERYRYISRWFPVEEE